MLEWSSQSSDLNPTESLWFDLKMKNTKASYSICLRSGIYLLIITCVRVYHDCVACFCFKHLLCTSSEIMARHPHAAICKRPLG